MTDISYYLQMSHTDLLAEQQRLRALHAKMLAEWADITRMGHKQYQPAAKANQARLHQELRLVVLALQQHEVCEAKASYSTKHVAAYHAARSRKWHGVPTMTYYKCKHCKRFHLTSNGYSKHTQVAAL